MSLGVSIGIPDAIGCVIGRPELLTVGVCIIGLSFIVEVVIVVEILTNIQ